MSLTFTTKTKRTKNNKALKQQQKAPTQQLESNSFPSLVTPQKQVTNSVFMDQNQKPNPQKVIFAHPDLEKARCNVLLFGNLRSNFENDQFISFHGRNTRNLSPFSTSYSYLNSEIANNNLDAEKMPIWNLAILPKDRTNYSQSSSVSSESLSSNEYDN